MSTHSKYDLIAIGDVTTDAFIQLSTATVRTDPKSKELTLTIPFANKIPYDGLKVVPAVGNSSNVAVGLSRLGFKTAILTGIGDDHYGQEILDHYDKEKVAKELVKINPGIPTNYHFVLTYDAERTILVRHEKFQYYPVESIGDVDWIYFSSIGEHALDIHNELAKYLENHPNIKMGFNPGTFQMKLGAEKLSQIYKKTHVLFVNREEAEHILETEETDIKILFQRLHLLGPKIIAITDGPKAAYASDGSKQYKTIPYPDSKKPISRTGAGDAFATGFMAGLMSGLSVPEALVWGPIESMNVVQAFGAQTNLLSKEQLLDYLAKAPAEYRAIEF